MEAIPDKALSGTVSSHEPARPMRCPIDAFLDSPAFLLLVCDGCSRYSGTLAVQPEVVPVVVEVEVAVPRSMPAGW